MRINGKRIKEYLYTFINYSEKFKWYHRDGRTEILTRKQIRYVDYKRQWWTKK